MGSSSYESTIELIPFVDKTPAKLFTEFPMVADSIETYPAAAHHLAVCGRVKYGSSTNGSPA
jgi:hypothetical protein